MVPTGTPTRSAIVRKRSSAWRWSTRVPWAMLSRATLIPSVIRASIFASEDTEGPSVQTTLVLVFIEVESMELAIPFVAVAVAQEPTPVFRKCSLVPGLARASASAGNTARRIRPSRVGHSRPIDAIRMVRPWFQVRSYLGFKAGATWVGRFRFSHDRPHPLCPQLIGLTTGKPASRCGCSEPPDSPGWRPSAARHRPSRW